MAGEPSFVQTGVRAAAFGATFAAWFGYLVALLRREKAGREDADTSRLLWVCTAGALGLAFLAAFTLRATAWGGAASFVAGLLVTWAGLALGEWGRRCLGRHYHPVVTIDAGHTLVTTGPYRLIRHPIYAGRMLSLAGLGLAMGNWLALAACLILPIYGFAARIAVEEAAMLEATGERYASYSRTTSRIVPRVW